MDEGEAVSYIRQKELNDCLPVAMYNFLVWANHNPVESDLILLKKIMQTKPELGTPLMNGLMFLEFFSEEYDINCLFTRSIRSAVKAITSGGCFFFTIDGADGVPHICFCSGVEDGKFVAWNVTRTIKKLKITKQALKNMAKNNKHTTIFITVEKK